MTSDIVPFQPPAPTGDTFALAPQAWTLANKVANTEFVPKGLRGKPEAVLACILAGHEAGLSPMTSLRSIFVVDGRPTMSAELMRAVINRAGHEMWVEETSTTRAVVVGKRAGKDRELRVVWTEDDARRAGLLVKDNWKKYPRAMLIARATTELARMMFPDVLAGISHSIEELADGGIEDGPLEHLGPPESPPAAPATATTAPRTAQARRAATAPTTGPDTEPMAPMTRPNRGPAPALPGEEDDIVDAELVEEVADAVYVEFSADDPAEDDIVEPPDDDLPDDDHADQWTEDDDPPLPDPGPRLTGPQIIAMRLADHGIRARDDKLRYVGHLVGRQVGTSNDLTPDEIRTVITWLDQLEDGEQIEPLPNPDAPPPAPAPTPATRTVAVTPPEEWTGDRWREYLKGRKLKVAPVIQQAQRLGAERTPTVVVAMLDDLTGSGICADLIGWCEEQGS